VTETKPFSISKRAVWEAHRRVKSNQWSALVMANLLSVLGFVSFRKDSCDYHFSQPLSVIFDRS
jgi:hypothetical protein